MRPVQLEISELGISGCGYFDLERVANCLVGNILHYGAFS